MIERLLKRSNFQWGLEPVDVTCRPENSVVGIVAGATVAIAGSILAPVTKYWGSH